jgi:L-ascorbate metabolism protein UlaG (beta-lactamase superfamily)
VRSACRGEVRSWGAAADLGRIDAVLHTHDHHDDNLDSCGRALLPSAGVVVTTVSGARRLGGGAHALKPWGTTLLVAYRPRRRRAVSPHHPRTAIPIHYEGWKRFQQGREAIEREFAGAPEDIRRRIRWLPIGVEVDVVAQALA